MFHVVTNSREQNWAGSLPDVVNVLPQQDIPSTPHPALSQQDTHPSLYPASTPQQLYTQAHNMLGTRDNHYIEMGDARARRPHTRPPPPPGTPQGLGAAPQGLGAAPIPVPTMVMGGNAPLGASGGWRQNSQYSWPAQSPPLDQSVATMTSGVGTGVGVACSFAGLPSEGEGARVRSASSEPRGPGGSGGDRRVRCSSATRSRQQRPRPAPGERGPSTANMGAPTFMSSPGGCYVGQPPHSPPPGAPQPAAGSAIVSGVLARLAGCYENIEPGRESNESGAYGYQVSDLEALLTRASPTRPANLPMVLTSSTRLHNMRRTPDTTPGSNQVPVRPFLPQGVIVNAVFKTRDWLYVRTAHGAEGYVPYRVCRPLGILPPPKEDHNITSTPVDMGVWASRNDDYQSALTQIPVASMVPSGMGGVVGENVGQTRGRSRGRRRPPCTDSCNQTDTQKLQPGGRSISESRPPRESLDPPPNVPTPVTDHVLV